MNPCSSLAPALLPLWPLLLTILRTTPVLLFRVMAFPNSHPPVTPIAYERIFGFLDHTVHLAPPPHLFPAPPHTPLHLQLPWLLSVLPSTLLLGSSGPEQLSSLVRPRVLTWSTCTYRLSFALAPLQPPRASGLLQGPADPSPSPLPPPSLLIGVLTLRNLSHLETHVFSLLAPSESRAGRSGLPQPTPVPPPSVPQSPSPLH